MTLGETPVHGQQEGRPPLALRVQGASVTQLPSAATQLLSWEAAEEAASAGGGSLAARGEEARPQQ